MAFQFTQSLSFVLRFFLADCFIDSGCNDLPHTPDAHRRRDEGEQQDRGEHGVGRHRVAMLAHEVPSISEVQNAGDRHGQDDGIERLRDNHDEYRSCLEDRHHQPER